MPERDGVTGEYVILSEPPNDNQEDDTWMSIVLSGILLVPFTLIYIYLLIYLPIGNVLEPLSNFFFDTQGITVGFGDRPFGLREITSVYAAGLFLFLSDVLRAAPNLMSQYISEDKLGPIMKTRPRIWGNILIFLIIIPFVVIVVTTLSASRLSNVEDLWEMMMAGYAGALIGAYRQMVSYLFSVIQNAT